MIYHRCQYWALPWRGHRGRRHHHRRQRLHRLPRWHRRRRRRLVRQQQLRLRMVWGATGWVRFCSVSDAQRAGRHQRPPKPARSRPGCWRPNCHRRHRHESESFSSQGFWFANKRITAAVSNSNLYISILKYIQHVLFVQYFIELHFVFTFTHVN